VAAVQVADTYQSARFDDFNDIFRITQRRLRNSKPGVVPFVGPAPGIVRTFLVNREDVDWRYWAILKKLKRLEDEASGDNKPVAPRIMANRVRYCSPEEYRREHDIILFFQLPNAAQGDIRSYDSAHLPQGAQGVGIREEGLNLRDKKTRSMILVDQDEIFNEYTYAIDVWQNASEQSRPPGSVEGSGSLDLQAAEQIARENMRRTDSTQRPRK
jgi:hypothetical protein